MRGLNFSTILPSAALWSAFVSAPADSDELALVRAIRAGDRDAFERLVWLYHRRIFAVAYRMVGSRADAEDICQEVFWKVYRNLNRYDPARPLLPWVRRIACNHTLNFLRRRRIERRLFEGAEESGEARTADGRIPADEVLLAEERERRLQGALLRLPPPQRIVFALKYVEDLTAEEIGQALNVPRNTVKTWLYRARETLRRALADAV